MDYKNRTVQSDSNLLSKKISLLVDLATPGVSGGNSNDSFMLQVTKLWAANQILV